MPTYRVLVLALLSLGTVCAAYGQAQDFRFDRISVEDGLSNANVTSIVRDPEGFMWFGTHDGLNRYDGYTFEVFRHDPDVPGAISHSYVNALLVDRDGTLWIGTGSGLNRFDAATNSFAAYLHDPEDSLGVTLSDPSVSKLYEDRAGTLWVGTGSGLNRFDAASGTFERFVADPDDATKLSDGEISAIVEDEEGSLWIGTHGGLHRLDRATGRFERFYHDPADPNSLVHDQVMTVYEDSEGTLWVGTCATVERAYDPSAGSIEVIPQEIGRVLLNLLGNAFYAVHQRSGRLEAAYVPVVRVSTRSVESGVEIRVWDNGGGIPLDIRERIFEPFFTTKPTGKGTGLGLSLSNEIVTQGHGGTLSVESVEGEDTLFAIRLPAEKLQVRPAPVQSPSRGQFSHTGAAAVEAGGTPGFWMVGKIGATCSESAGRDGSGNGLAVESHSNREPFQQCAQALVALCKASSRGKERRELGGCEPWTSAN